jgi:membrane protein implicated in regulation of membrane protease activity
MNNLWNYTNGAGHLIMSILATITGLIMILIPGDATIRATGVSIILSVNAYWFVSGAAKQVASEAVKQLRSSQPLSEDTVKLPKVTKPPGA